MHLSHFIWINIHEIISDDDFKYIVLDRKQTIYNTCLSMLWKTDEKAPTKFLDTVELATSDLGSCDKSLQPTYLKSPCRIPIFPMYSSSAHPTRYNRQIATYDMICPVPWGVYLLYLTRHNRHFFPKHFRPQPKSNRVRAMFLTAYLCHERDQHLVMRCYIRTLSN